MKIIRGLERITPDDHGSVAAIGNFDGVHLGHQTIICEAGRIARGLGASPAVLTFEPLPRMLFQPDAPPFRLTTSDLRAAAIAEHDVALLFELQFDIAFSQLSPEAFVVKILKQRLGLIHLVCGYDFVFGHRRRGTPEMLQSLCRDLGIGVTSMRAAAEPDGAIYSSSRVRQCLAEGDPTGARDLLGRAWRFTSTVEEGDRRGRSIGFPTCNLRIVDLIQPAHGVYAIRVRIGGEAVWRNGVANFGRRPTVNDRGPLFEAHIFDMARDLYGEQLTIEVIDFIRPEMKFSGLDALKAQISADAARARALLADCRHPGAGD